jgi:hypothetical protein
MLIELSRCLINALQRSALDLGSSFYCRILEASNSLTLSGSLSLHLEPQIHPDRIHAEIESFESVSKKEVRLLTVARA